MVSAQLLLLAFAVVGCQCWKLPAIPEGRRAQYYTQQSDGTYKFGFDTPEGLFQVQHGDASNEVSGTFGHSGGNVQYTAGVGGFRVFGEAQDTAGGETGVAQGYSNPIVVHQAAVGELSAHPVQVQDTAEVAQAKLEFQTAYDAAAAAAEAAPDTGIITGVVVDHQAYIVPAVHTQDQNTGYKQYSTSANVKANVRDATPEELNTHPVQVQDTAEVIKAKLEFQAAYDAAAAAAEAAPDTDIINAADDFHSMSAADASYSALSGGAVVEELPASYSKPADILHFGSSSSSDGSYEFAYETRDSSRHETADGDNNVKGNFEFVGDDNERRRVDYMAGASTGFVVTGDHLPASVQDTPDVKAAKAAFRASFNQAAASDRGIGNEGDDVNAVLAAISYNAPETSAVRSNSQSDGSYEFSYETSDSSRYETADANNNVKGNYEYVGGDNERRRVNYIAGASTGFVATGDHLPTSVEDTAEVKAAKAAFRSSVAKAVEHDINNKGYGDEKVVAVSYYAPTTLAVHSGSGIDGSYEFSYDTSDSSRYETADAHNNVKGNYEYVADDNQIRRVNYIAGASTGFVATGDHLPTSVEDTPEVKAAKIAFRTTYNHAAANGDNMDGQDKEATPAVVAVSYSAPEMAAAHSASSNIDGSYEFSYETQDSSRYETADAHNNVRGNYEYTGSDNQKRRVDYSAGAATGFVATGHHLPTNVEDTADVKAAKTAFRAAFNQAAADENRGNEDEGETSAVVAVAYSAPETAAVHSDIGFDGSYEFSYETPDSSRYENADSHNNVKGNYEYVGNDNQRRRVNYIAGASTGFVATGDHLPTSVEDTPEVKAAKAAFWGTFENVAENDGGLEEGAEKMVVAVSYKAPETLSAHSVSSGGAGGSYEFSYETSDSARHESADAHNNVKGNYEYVTGDDQKRRVDYIAGADTGFVATSAHLPQPVQDTAEVAAAKVAAAPDQSHAAAVHTLARSGLQSATKPQQLLVPGPAPVTLLQRSNENVMTYSLDDGVSVTLADGSRSPGKFGYLFH